MVGIVVIVVIVVVAAAFKGRYYYDTKHNGYQLQHSVKGPNNHRLQH